MRKISLFVSTCIAASSTFATDNNVWLIVAESEKATQSASPTRWKAQTKSVVQAWIKAEEKKYTKGSKYKYSLSDYRINCKEDSLYIASSTYYDPKGVVVNSDKKQYPAFEAVIPESVGEEILRALCEASQDARSELN